MGGVHRGVLNLGEYGEASFIFVLRPVGKLLRVAVHIYQPLQPQIRIYQDLTICAMLPGAETAKLRLHSAKLSHVKSPNQDLSGFDHMRTGMRVAALFRKGSERKAARSSDGCTLQYGTNIARRCCLFARCPMHGAPTYSHALILMLSPCERVGHGRAVPWPLTLMKQRVQERVGASGVHEALPHPVQPIP